MYTGGMKPPLFISVARWSFDIFWAVMWTTATLLLWGTRAGWFSILAALLAPGPALYDGYRVLKAKKTD